MIGIMHGRVEFPGPSSQYPKLQSVRDPFPTMRMGLRITAVASGTEIPDHYSDRVLTVTDDTAVQRGDTLYVTAKHFTLLEAACT